MELVESLGGLGRMEVSREETDIVNALFNVFKNERIQLYSTLFEEQTRKVAELLKTVSPTLGDLFDSSRLPREGFLRFSSEICRYTGLENYSELSISMPLRGYGNAPTVLRQQSGTPELALIKTCPAPPALSHIYASLEMSPQYGSSCVDDLVHLFGKQQELPLRGVEEIQHTGVYNPVFGIANVPRLEEVFDAYRKAEELLTDAPKKVDASRKELDILRRDAKSHENVAMRRMSKTCYDNALLTLSDSS